MKKILQQSIVVAGLIAGTPANAEQEISVVESFAIQPAIRSVQLSPDGKQLALVRATSKDGDYIIEIHQTNSLAKERVTKQNNSREKPSCARKVPPLLTIARRRGATGIARAGDSCPSLSKIAVRHSCYALTLLLPARKTQNCTNTPHERVCLLHTTENVPYIHQTNHQNHWMCI